MKKIRTIIELVILAILIITIVILSFSLHHLRESSTSNIRYHQDTIKVEKVYVPKKEYIYWEVPKYLTLYARDSVIVDSIKLDLNNIHLYLQDRDSNISTQFLAKYPNAEKLIQFTTNKNKLSLVTLQTNGSVISKDYKLNTYIKDYNYTNNELTSKPRNFFRRIAPVVEFTFRPINLYSDLDLGLMYKTSNIYYEAGLNLNYYPRIKNSLGYDVYLRFRYEF